MAANKAVGLCPQWIEYAGLPNTPFGGFWFELDAMEKEHGSSMQWMKKIKTLLDPNGILNPGKIFPE